MTIPYTSALNGSCAIRVDLRVPLAAAAAFHPGAAVRNATHVCAGNSTIACVAAGQSDGTETVRIAGSVGKCAFDHTVSTAADASAADVTVQVVSPSCRGGEDGAVVWRLARGDARVVARDGVTVRFNVSRAPWGDVATHMHTGLRAGTHSIVVEDDAGPSTHALCCGARDGSTQRGCAARRASAAGPVARRRARHGAAAGGVGPHRAACVHPWWVRGDGRQHRQLHGRPACGGRRPVLAARRRSDHQPGHPARRRRAVRRCPIPSAAGHCVSRVGAPAGHLRPDQRRRCGCHRRRHRRWRATLSRDERVGCQQQHGQKRGAADRAVRGRGRRARQRDGLTGHGGTRGGGGAGAGVRHHRRDAAERQRVWRTPRASSAWTLWARHPGCWLVRGTLTRARHRSHRATTND